MGSLMGFIYSVVGFILAIGILVTVHEFGHFWVARKLGVKVLRFSVGFGKPLWKKVSGPDQTEYVLAAIPLGGYVKMLGENDPDAPVAPNERHRAFDNQPIWKRSLIVVAGPGINFLFAILLFMLIGMQDQEQLIPVLGEVPASTPLAQAGVKAGDRLISVNGKSFSYFGERDLFVFNQVLQKEPLRLTVESQGSTNEVVVPTADIPIYNINPASLMYQLGFFQVEPPSTREIAAISPKSPAEKAGLQSGDKFVSIDGVAISNWRDLTKLVQPAAGKPLDIVLERDGAEFSISVTPEAVPVGDKQLGRLGVQRPAIPYLDEQIVTISKSPLAALAFGGQQTWQMSTLTLRMLWKMVTLQVTHKNINGPIMIADVAGKVIQVGIKPYLYFLAVISISLGVMNLLPVPMLDGGHLMRFAVEVVGGKTAAEKFFIAIQPLGLVMLFGLMSLAFYNDILKIFN